MNCDELSTVVEGTLLRQRDPQWLREARDHAEQCPSCAQLMELQRLEERLTELPVAELSEVLVQAVMNQITQLEPVVGVSSRRSWWWTLKCPTVLVGTLVLVVAYSYPAVGDSWLSRLWSSGGFLRALGISDYLAHHPPWAVLIAGLGALLIVLGLFAPESETPETTRRRSTRLQVD